MPLGKERLFISPLARFYHVYPIAQPFGLQGEKL